MKKICLWKLVLSTKEHPTSNEKECLALCNGLNLSCPSYTPHFKNICEHYPECFEAGNKHFLQHLCSKDYQTCPTYKRIKSEENHQI